MDNLWLKVENIVAKGEIACFEQFLLLSLCFQKAVSAAEGEDQLRGWLWSDKSHLEAQYQNCLAQLYFIILVITLSHNSAADLGKYMVNLFIPFPLEEAIWQNLTHDEQFLSLQQCFQLY